MKLHTAIEKYIQRQQMKIKRAMKEGDKKYADSVRSSLTTLQSELKAEISQEESELLQLINLIHEGQYQ